MTSCTQTHPKLSLVTAYDDLCRFSNSLITLDENEYMQLIHNLEENRIRWLSTHRDLVSITDKYNQLLETNKTQEVTIRHLRYSLAKEVQTKNELRKERDALRQQLDAIRKFVLEEPTTAVQNQNTRQKMLSYLNLHRLDTLVENSNSSDESSNNDIEFDKTDDEVLDERSKHSFVSKRKSDHRVDGENVYSSNAYNDKALSPKRNRVSGMGCAVTDDQMNIEVIGDQELLETNQEIEENEHLNANIQQIPQTGRNRGNLNTVAVLNEFGSLRFLPVNSQSQLPKSVSQTSISNRFDSRMHSFVKKKAFKPEKCDPCGKKIGFCSDCYKCRDCFATCHMECHDKVPLPCIPFNRQNVNENEPRLIADYVSGSVRPAIPAQIVKLCNEIEKRGLDEEGLYRIPGSYDMVNQLYRDMFVRPKKSLPSLSTFEVKVLCSVLKKFLMSLKEPLVTRILWRDFVQAAEQKNIEDEHRLIKQSISELPTANRDTLAFLMVHLQRIAKSVSTKMDEKNIATVLGPTIIGHSTPNLPYMQIMAEFKPQIKVLESLLRMSEDYWNSVASATPSLQSSPYTSPDKRQSLGTRLFGGTNVQSGFLTPYRSTRTLTRGTHRLKPLF